MLLSKYIKATNGNNENIKVKKKVLKSSWQVKVSVIEYLTVDVKTQVDKIFKVYAANTDKHWMKNNVNLDN